MATGTLTNKFHSAGLYGQTGSQLDGQNMNLATIDWTDSGAILTHPGFNDQNGASRIWAQHICSASSCAPISPLATGWNHATAVASILAGDITRGQDPSILALPVLRNARSGQARRAWLLHYVVDSCASTAKAIERAVADGADVINMSMWVASTAPSSTFDCGGINAMIRASLTAGVAVFASTGNEGASSIHYPAYRPETVAVGALDTSSSGTAYLSTTMAGYSNWGSRLVKTADGYNAVYPAVGLIAPGRLDLVTYQSPSSYATGSWGTSFATPAVAGAAALMEQGYAGRGWTNLHGQFYAATMLMFGDGWDASTNTTRTSGLHTQSGAGRLRARFPDSADFTGGWAWGFRAVTLSQGQEVCWGVSHGGPLEASYTTWKWAARWTEPDLMSIADIDLRVLDACNGNAYVVGQNDRAIDNRIELKSAAFSGKCLRACLYGYMIPAGTTRTVYTVDFIHSDVD